MFYILIGNKISLISGSSPSYALKVLYHDFWLIHVHASDYSGHTGIPENLS